MTVEHNVFVLVMRFHFFLLFLYSILNHKHHLNVFETSIVMVLFSHLSEGEVAWSISSTGGSINFQRPNFPSSPCYIEGSLMYIQ